MIDEGLQGVDFVAINTDAQALMLSKASIRVRVGEKLTRGLGSGGDPEVGRKATEESAEELYSVLKGLPLSFELSQFLPFRDVIGRSPGARRCPGTVMTG